MVESCHVIKSCSPITHAERNCNTKSCGGDHRSKYVDVPECQLLGPLP